MEVSGNGVRAWRGAMRRQGRRVRVLDLVVCFLYPYFLPFIAFSFFLGPGLKTQRQREGVIFFQFWIQDEREIKGETREKDEKEEARAPCNTIVVIFGHIWSYFVRARVSERL